jgi:hypothetical protein
MIGAVDGTPAAALRTAACRLSSASWPCAVRKRRVEPPEASLRLTTSVASRVLPTPGGPTTRCAGAVVANCLRASCFAWSSSAKAASSSRSLGTDRLALHGSARKSARPGWSASACMARSLRAITCCDPLSWRDRRKRERSRSSSPSTSNSYPSTPRYDASRTKVACSSFHRGAPSAELGLRAHPSSPSRCSSVRIRRSASAVSGRPSALAIGSRSLSGLARTVSLWPLDARVEQMISTGSASRLRPTASTAWIRVSACRTSTRSSTTSTSTGRSSTSQSSAAGPSRLCLSSATLGTPTTSMGWLTSRASTGQPGAPTSSRSLAAGEYAIRHVGSSSRGRFGRSSYRMVWVMR